MNQIIGYVRVSTKRQGESGLGIEAQIDAIQSYAARTHAAVVAIYREVESGKNDGRPELAKAIAHARRASATFVVAKLDRMGRRAAYLLGLIDELRGKVPVVFCDNPSANELTVGILAVVAQDEARRISQRVKDALAAYRRGGRVSKRIQAMYPEGVPQAVVEATAGRLGASLPQCRSNLTAEARGRGRAAAVAVVAKQAREAYSDIAPEMRRMRKEGSTLNEIVNWLTAQGHRTRKGKTWNPMQVKRVLDRG